MHKNARFASLTERLKKKNEDTHVDDANGILE